MYSLNHTPVLLEFLNRFLKISKSKIKLKNTNKLYLYDKCYCRDKKCSSLIFKSTNKINEEQYLYHCIETNQGTFIIELYDDGFFELSVINYKDIPYKKELDKFFKNKKINKKILIKSDSKTNKLSRKDEFNLRKYFRNLKIEDKYLLHENIDDFMNEFI